MTKLTMKLIIDGKEKQRLEGNLTPTNEFESFIRKFLVDTVRVSGENHINPEAIRDESIAYHTLASIRRDYQIGKQIKNSAKITMEYSE